MELLYRIIVLIFGLWMLLVSVMMLSYPQKALNALRKFASTNLINYTELGLRFSVGMAFMGLAPFTDYSSALKVCGAFLIITAIILMLIPRRWHHSYAVWWADKLKPWQIQMATPLSFAVGAAAIGMAIGGGAP